MARVVQRRTSPPYLLILMVFLFLLAATLAVLGFVKADKEADEKAAEQARCRKLQAEFKQLQAHARDLARSVSTKETVKDVEDAEKEALIALKTIESERGLADEAMDLHRRLGEANARLAEMQTVLKEMQTQLSEKDELVNRVSADLQAKIDQLQEKVDSLDNRASEDHSNYLSDLAQARREWGKQQDDLNKIIASKTQEIQQLQQTNAQLSSQVASLKIQLKKETSPLADPMTVALQPDGKILKVLAAEDLCYINLGSKDRVTPGLTFTVYPSTGIPKDGQGKATAVVSNVGENTSECRLRDQKSEDPVVTGDLVANLAFDPARTYRFVVIGTFDLYGTGQASREGADEARMLIERFGGTVADEVNVDTDFIIVGEKPARPTEPGPSASPHELENYRQQVKIAERFDGILALAKSMQIPMLNTNRFLAFIGYTPTKAGG